MKAEEYLNRQEGYNVDRILDDKDLTLCVIDLLAEYASHQNQQLIEALKEIVSPIEYMKNRLNDGEKLDGTYAIMLSRSESYLKEIAQKALDSQNYEI